MKVEFHLHNQLRSLRLLVPGLLWLFATANSAALQQLAFPGADGYGRYSVGGRGGKVYVVTTLEDNPDQPQPGSLRYAIEQPGARFITFAVSGIIRLQAPLAINEGFVTVAGQTSPNGIVVSGQPFSVNASQVIIRYVRFRLGLNKDSVDTISGVKVRDVIIDHCSFSWSIDETASFYSNINFTLQYSIISQSLNHATHTKGDHGYGGIWGGAGASFHHNVIAHHSSRTPRINGYRLRLDYAQRYEFTDIRNNVIYNWGQNSAYGAEDSVFNLVDNIYIAGPASKVIRIFQFYRNTEEEHFGRGYFAGNVLENQSRERVTKKTIAARTIKVSKPEKKHNYLLDQPVSINLSPFFTGTEDYLTQHNAEEAYYLLIVLREVGANRNAHGPFLDSVDTRVLEDVRTRSARSGKNGIIDSELEVIESWDKYAEQFVGNPQDQFESDKDLDGMPDRWEAEKKVSEPAANDLDPDYTNIEMYLNEIGNFGNPNSPE